MYLKIENKHEHQFFFYISSKLFRQFYWISYVVIYSLHRLKKAPYSLYIQLYHLCWRTNKYFEDFLSAIQMGYMDPVSSLLFMQVKKFIVILSIESPTLA